ncbi:hypothetical protein GR157_17595 [Burkholderia sp. 4701]|nr:hypothetical protein [Burkholderia sp. 4701]MXN83646.1 hypothetical protein [Burkholderia sp. 4812]
MSSISSGKCHADLELGHPAFVECRTMSFLRMQYMAIGGFGETVALLKGFADGFQFLGSQIDATRGGIPLHGDGQERGRAVGEQRRRQPVARGRAAPRREMCVMLGFDAPLPVALDVERGARLRGTRDRLLQLKLADERNVARTVPV